MTISNPTPDMRWTHTDDAHLFWIGGEVQIDMGYVGDLTEGMMVGKITAVKASFPASGVPTLTVTCTGHGQKLNGCQKTRTHTGKTDKQIAEQIGQDIGLQVQADETDIVHDYMIQPNQTDLQFLRARAELLHYELFVKDKTLFFRKPKEDEENVYTFVWSSTRAFTAAGSQTLPLKSFVPNADALNEQYTQTEIRAYDAKTKKVIIGQASNQEENPMGGTQTGSKLREQALGSCKKTQASKPVASKPEADHGARSGQNKSAQKFVTGNAQTIGVPDLGPGVVVFLDGVGLFSGKYYVTSVTHTIGGNGYTTDFEVRRNSTNAK